MGDYLKLSYLLDEKMYFAYMKKTPTKISKRARIISLSVG